MTPADRYEPVVALDVRSRLATATKLFCNCAAAPGDPPNVHTCPVCLGLPGALPALNARAVELAARTALALGCTVHAASAFARRHGGDAGHAKGYQITQTARPLATGGAVQIGETPEGAPLTVAVTRVHLEEDAGRVLHAHAPGGAAVDFNRAGAPLVRITSAPELRSVAEVGAFLRVLQQRVRHVGASTGAWDADALRVDAHVSVRERGDTALGARCDVADLDSPEAVARAVDAEFVRQTALLAAGRRVEGRTARWNAERAELESRPPAADTPNPWYTVEFDLGPLLLTREWIDAQRALLPEPPAARRTRFKREYALDDRALDALAGDLSLADYYESVARLHGDPRAAAEWVLGDVAAILRADGGGESALAAFSLRVRPADLAALLDMVRDERVSPTGARQLFAIMARTGLPPERAARGA